MTHFDIIILGAGASGCMCALECAKSGKNILLIDKTSKAGKKLMATGNGRCNLTNQDILLNKHSYNQNIDKYLDKFNSKDLISYFQNLGLVMHVDEERRVYPFSNSAKSVIDIINNKLETFSNITLSLENEIQNVEKNENFTVYTSKGEFSCEKLVVATGGKTVEDLIDKFNIKAKPFVPSLVALKTQNTRILDGVRVSNAKVEGICGDKKYSEIGEILFKDSGISGIVAFNVSTLFARANYFNGKIKIDLMPDLDWQSLKSMLLERRNLNVKIKNFFDGMFVSQIGYYILNNSKIKNEDRLSRTLTEDEINEFVNQIKNVTLNVKGYYNNNQVYSGGVSLSELTDELECKKIPNLYFCGEVCDVDGICGGFNLQWAWTSGYIVGENL